MPPRKKTKAAVESPLPPSVSGAGATVPPEILFEIIQEFAGPSCNDKGKINYRTRALGAMCRVNKHWRSIAHASLYQCLSFVEKPEQMAKLRRTVVGSPAIAGLITELDIHVVGERDLPNAPAALKKSVARRQRAGKDLWDVLEVLTGLKTLKIRQFEKLPKAYQERLQTTKRFPNLSTVRSFDIIHSDAAIATILTQSMTSLEELYVRIRPLCAGIIPLAQGDFRLFEKLPVYLTQLSITEDWGLKAIGLWDDWYNVVKCSKGTLHTLVLEQTDGMPSSILESAFELVSPSLLRLFYSTRAPDLQAVLLAALPKFKKLISLRTSLPTTTILEWIPPTIMELGMAHNSRYYEEEESVQAVRRATLNRAKDLPNLKILWLAGKWRYSNGENHRQLEEWKEKAVAEGMVCKLLTPTLNRLCMLPVYGDEDELPYLPELRLIPGVYVARVKTGTAKVFDPAVFSRLTQK
ncbi:hypothetical protein FIBSPDRAFT_1041593 [Athelia psychrophila]|uniref:F-box domain-containing protein n=1 Tax=Athelia psychrophila TaxID=1759441 RepID=A0A166NK04_9AGAM|nr:hypothetical protein FIBSPDRAFT_1041593 [Fibularhizoctonia sp. CBS 109695]